MAPASHGRSALPIRPRMLTPALTGFGHPAQSAAHAGHQRRHGDRAAPLAGTPPRSPRFEVSSACAGPGKIVRDQDAGPACRRARHDSVRGGSSPGRDCARQRHRALASKTQIPVAAAPPAPPGRRSSTARPAMHGVRTERLQVRSAASRRSDRPRRAPRCERQNPRHSACPLRASLRFRATARGAARGWPPGPRCPRV